MVESKEDQNPPNGDQEFVVYKPRTHYSQNALRNAMGGNFDPLNKAKHING